MCSSDLRCGHRVGGGTVLPGIPGGNDEPARPQLMLPDATVEEQLLCKALYRGGCIREFVEKQDPLSFQRKP